MAFVDKLNEIERLRKVIEQHGKLSDEVLKKINYKFRLEWNYTSNNMEGNSLTRQETRSVMVGNITVEGKPLKDVFEMKGHDEVISDILKIGKGDLNISEKRIKNVHKAIVHEEDPEKQKQIGIWKQEPNYLYNYKNERFVFAAPADVPGRMHTLINELNAKKEKVKEPIDAVHLAFWFHLEYITIHPFYDGNGRTARIFTNLILIASGFPPIYIKENEKAVYYQYLADIQGYGGSPELFYEFMAGLLIRSQQVVLDAIEGKEIEETDDWEKKLSLLKKQLSADEEVKITRSASAISDIAQHSVLPLIDRMMEKLQEFDELFTEKRMSFGDQSTRHLIHSKAQLRELLSTNPEKYLNEIHFSYQLAGFKKAGPNTFTTSIDVTWQFEQYKYYFFLDHKDYNKATVKLYHQNFTEEEIQSIISESGKWLLKKIEDSLMTNK